MEAAWKTINDDCESTRAALYDIHGLACFLEGVSHVDPEDWDGGGITDPLSTMGSVIKEKVAFCLATLEKMEEKTREVKP